MGYLVAIVVGAVVFFSLVDTYPVLWIPVLLLGFAVVGVVCRNLTAESDSTDMARKRLEEQYASRVREEQVRARRLEQELQADFESVMRQIRRSDNDDL